MLTIAGCGSPTSSGTPTPHSWNVTMHLTGEDDDNRAFTFAYFDSGDTLSAFLGANGNMTSATFDRSKQDGSLILAAPCSDFGPVAPSITTLQTMTVHPVDSDGDGNIDRLAGSAVDVRKEDGDDPQYITETFTVEAVPDVIAPTLHSEQLHNPLDPVGLLLSEPVAEASVWLMGDPQVTFPGPPSGGALIQLASDTVLPFAQTWQLGGTGLDFAGNSLVVDDSFSTLADPGIFAQDGFEGPPAGALTKGANVIDATSGITPPTGEHALLVDIGSSATFHLKSAGDVPATVSFSFLELANRMGFGEGDGSVRVEAAVIGGTARVSAPFQPVGQVAITTARWSNASTPVTMTVPLTEKGTDVVVRFIVRTCTGCSLFASVAPSSLVIDDLKLL